jgi:tetratricopeptide (TPR) repeat protein
MENDGMESTRLSSKTLGHLGELPEFKDLPDWRKLRKAINEPVKEIILAEIDTPVRAHQAIDQLAKLYPNRRQIVIEFDPSTDDANNLIAACQAKETEVTPETGVIFILDSSHISGDATDPRSVAFWQAMNMLRERWDHVNAQIVLFIQPRNYRLLSSVADHLKRWIPLKIHLIPKLLTDFVTNREIQDLRVQRLASENARQSLEVLENQLAAALKRGESPTTFAARYYIPMFIAAVDARDFKRADDLHAKLLGAQIPIGFFADWSRTITAYHAERGNLNEATKCAEAYLKWARWSKRAYDEAAACYLFGVLWRFRENTKEAEIWLKKSLTLFEKVGANSQLHRLYGELANVARDRGSFAESESLYLRALKLAEDTGDKDAVAVTFQNLGIQMAMQKQYARAEELLQKAVEAAKNIKCSGIAASSFFNLGVVAHHRGDPVAEEMWRKRFIEASAE